MGEVAERDVRRSDPDHDGVNRTLGVENTE